MNRLLTDEQAAYLSQLYTGTEVPRLHHAMRENAKWPRFSDGAPVVIGDRVKGVMCDVEVASIVFRADYIVLYDSQMFHYVKLDGGESAQRPDGTRLPLD